MHRQISMQKDTKNKYELVYLEPDVFSVTETCRFHYHWAPSPSVSLGPISLSFTGPHLPQFHWAPSPSVSLDPISLSFTGTHLPQFHWAPSPSVSLGPDSFSFNYSLITKGTHINEIISWFHS